MEIDYKIIYYKKALKDLENWKLSGNKIALKKLFEIISLLEKNPLQTSIGNPEKLKYTDAWSRRINKKDRITYLVNEKEKEIVILRMMGHYEDK